MATIITATSTATALVGNGQMTVVKTEPTEPKDGVVDAAVSCDKRKLSPDVSTAEQANVVKKLKDTKTQPGKRHYRLERYIVADAVDRIILVLFPSFQTLCASALKSVPNACRNGPKTSCSKFSGKWTTRIYKINSYKSLSRRDLLPIDCSAKRLQPTGSY